MSVTDQELAQALANMEGQQRQLILMRAADLVLDRHVNDSPISDAQIREYFPGKTDAEISNAAQSFLDDMYDYHDGDIGKAITALVTENGVSASNTTPPQPEPTAQPEPAAQTEEAAPEPEPKNEAAMNGDLSRGSLEAISSYEGFPQNVRDSAQRILQVADQEHDGDIGLAVASLREEENPPAMDAVLNGEVEVSTSPMFEIETFRSAFEGAQPMQPLTAAEDAELRENYQSLIDSGTLSNIGNTEVLINQVMNYADAEHEGSLSGAMNALAEMGPDQAYETLEMENFTVTQASLPAGLDASSPEPAPVESPAPAPSAEESTEASVEPATGMKIAEISATLGSIPPAMITRANLENVAQNGIPDGIENMIGVTSENAQSMAQEALELTDSRFDGNLNAAVSFLQAEGQNEQYANLTVSQLSDALESSPEVVQQPAAQTTTAGATTAGIASVLNEEQRARLQTDMTNMFNNAGAAFREGDFEAGIETGFASMEGFMEQLMEVFQQFLNGDTPGFSTSNDATAFAGAQAPNGYAIPEGTQLNPATGEPVQTAAADNENREPALATVGMRA